MVFKLNVIISIPMCAFKHHFKLSKQINVQKAFKFFLQHDNNSKKKYSYSHIKKNKPSAKPSQARVPLQRRMCPWQKNMPLIASWSSLSLGLHEGRYRQKLCTSTPRWREQPTCQLSSSFNVHLKELLLFKGNNFLHQISIFDRLLTFSQQSVKVKGIKMSKKAHLSKIHGHRFKSRGTLTSHHDFIKPPWIKEALEINM